MTGLVVFCDDFRVKDNSALFYATQKHEKVILLYIFDKNYIGRDLGLGYKSFLYCTLKSFSTLLQKDYNAKLIIREGLSDDVISEIVEKHGVSCIYKSESYDYFQFKQEQELKEKFKDKIQFFKGKTLFHPNEIKTNEGNHFKIYTPFYKSCIVNRKKIEETLPEPTQINAINNIDSLSVEDLGLKNDLTQNIQSIYEFDYEKITNNAQDFLKNKIKSYEENRNIPSLDATSKFSPYFRVGILSPRMIYNAAQFYFNTEKFISEIIWREFACHVGFFYQDIHKKTFKQNYNNFEFDDNKYFYNAWKNGETGFDFVDAGMKELVATGNMHNRVRMVVASCLIKDLLINWRLGEEFFWEYLVDADPIVNPFSWQWVFGSGFDGAPYFRIFNPDLQLQRFDPNRMYCKKWLGNIVSLKKPIVDRKIQKNIILSRYRAVN